MALTVCVKGSNDHLKVHKELGDCPSSQRILMILQLKGVQFRRYLVDVTKKDQKKWEEYMRISQGRSKLPLLVHENLEEPLEDANRIEEYLDKTFPEPCLESSNAKAKVAGIEIYSKFALFMRNSIPENDSKLRSALDEELRKLDKFLTKDSPGVYLDGDRLKLPDCNLLPKLMHVEVAGELKDFKINHPGVTTYLKEAAKQKTFKDIFTESVKIDIKTGWRNKMGHTTG